VNLKPSAPFEIKKHSLARISIGAGSALLHLAVVAAVVWAGVETSSKYSKRGNPNRTDTLSSSLDPRPRLSIKLIAPTQSLVERPAPQESAGPLVSSKAADLASVPVKPQKFQEQIDAVTLGVEVNAKPLTGIMIGADLIPPQISRLKVRIWIDSVGLPEKAELLTQLNDPDAEKLILQAILEAIFMPAEKDGVTIASVAVLEFSRGEAEYSMPLTESSPVVTPSNPQ
jgi:hypothetical protein